MDTRLVLEVLRYLQTYITKDETYYEYIQNNDTIVISLASTHDSTEKNGPVNFRRAFIYESNTR